MPTRREVPGIRQYDSAAGGWGALRATARAVREQMEVDEAPLLLYRTNKPTGFDCPGCAWPDKEHTSTFQFCENGAKAVTWEATKKRVTNEFFATHTVSALLEWSDYELENEGRLTHPMAYDRGSDTYQPIAWDQAFVRIGESLRGMPDPNMVEFYTSGRASNEAAFLYQLFGREYGTNNFPDCSNMCHEATSVGLPQSIGIGKGTVSLDDFEHCELIIAMGHNPGTNHPRMMGTLHEASRRGVPIIVFNPLKERALERFTDPQNPIEMATLGSTRIASSYYQVKVGGDAAALKGIMKALSHASAAPSRIFKRPDRNPSPSRIRCRWCMHRWESCALPPRICDRSPPSSPAWRMPFCQAARFLGWNSSLTTIGSAAKSRLCSRTSRISTAAFEFPAGFGFLSRPP